MTKNTADDELEAIRQMLSALEPLDREARTRTVEYVFRRLGITTPESSQGGTGAEHADVILRQIHTSPTPKQEQLNDIRTFAKSKQPKSANEMAALVAYYLAELAPSGDRKGEIISADIDKYFKQATFPLPAAARHTLTNAKNAGYLDPGSGRGSFKLNPVGHNLVAHGLPSEGSSNTASVRRASSKKRRKAKPSSKKKSKKQSRKKKSKRQSR